MNPSRPANTRTSLLGASLAACLLLFAAGSASADAGIDNAKPKNARQKAVLKAIDHWRETYNTDVDTFIKDAYAKDADVVFTGASAHGHEQFTKIEKAVIAGAPGRKMRVDRVQFIDDNNAIVEAVNTDSAQPGFYTPWIAILTFDKDNKIILDRTYLHPERWPGIEGAKEFVTAGGLGAPNQVLSKP
jgi:hypothetical protein